MTNAQLPVDPALTDHFRQAMRSVASAVYLITSHGTEGDVGMTATAACSLSFDPMSVLICVNRSASIMRTLEESGQFVLNILSREDEAVATAFGSPAGRADRFADGDWYVLQGMPALKSSLSSIACDIAGGMDFGTLRHVDNRSGLAELLYCNGNFRGLSTE
jgi:flavin reductase